MPQINTTASGHVGPTPLPGGFSYQTYSNPHFLETLQRAVSIIDHRIKGSANCDKAFSKLPGGRTFTQVWADTTVWVNFDPARVEKRYGATRGKNITITAYSLAMGRWTVAATLVHELAHVNGASGSTHDAEGTLKNCLLAGLEDPLIIGSIVKSSQSQIA